MNLLKACLVDIEGSLFVLFEGISSEGCKLGDTMDLSMIFGIIRLLL